MRHETNHQRVVAKVEDDCPVGRLNACYPPGAYGAKVESDARAAGYIHPLVTRGSSYYCEVSGRSGMDHLIGVGTKTEAKAAESKRKRSRLVWGNPTEWDEPVVAPTKYVPGAKGDIELPAKQ